jgi:hypothetical protein
MCFEMGPPLQQAEGLVFLSKCHICCTVIQHKFIHTHSCCLTDLSVCLENCCWPSPAQAFLVLGPAGRMTHIFLSHSPLGLSWFHWPLSCNFGTSHIENTVFNSYSFFACISITTGTCLLSYCRTMDIFSDSSSQASCHNIIPTFA